MLTDGSGGIRKSDGLEEQIHSSDKYSKTLIALIHPASPGPGSGDHCAPG